MTAPVNVEFVCLPHGKGLDPPHYQTDGAAGFDLRAALPTGETTVLAPGEWRLIPTGFLFAIPDGYEGQVRPRSGLAAKMGVTVLNSPGTIDSDYRGELAVILINLGNASFDVTRGMRIAQMVIAPCVQATLTSVSSLQQTDRGQGGFGSTGTQ